MSRRWRLAIARRVNGGPFPYACLIHARKITLGVLASTKRSASASSQAGNRQALEGSGASASRVGLPHTVQVLELLVPQPVREELQWQVHAAHQVLETGESKVRVALIRNAFWTQRTNAVAYLPDYDGAESKGCTAVRQAVNRFRPNQGTSY